MIAVTVSTVSPLVSIGGLRECILHYMNSSMPVMIISLRFFITREKFIGMSR